MELLQKAFVPGWSIPASGSGYKGHESYHFLTPESPVIFRQSVSMLS